MFVIARVNLDANLKDRSIKKTYEEYFQYIDYAIDYIQNLKMYTPSGEKLVLNSNNKTKFLGFVMALTNFKFIYKQYCQNCNRNRGGFNNNPTAIKSL